ncbi:MAG: hypothetical protein IJD91_01100 [Clostridia bacterium]|nr:hypothetical protein [Clostridia bacterium]
MKRNVIKIIEECRKSGRITARYDMKVADAMSIKEFCHDDYELITRSFIFGYAQGYKAALNSQKK